MNQKMPTNISGASLQAQTAFNLGAFPYQLPGERGRHPCVAVAPLAAQLQALHARNCPQLPECAGRNSCWLRMVPEKCAGPTFRRGQSALSLRTLMEEKKHNPTLY
jgi:hypothetical protein